MARVVFGFLLLWLFLHGSVNGQDVATASSQCTSGFISMDSLSTLPENTLGRKNRAQRIIPSLNFSCDGAINKWIVRAQWNNGGTVFPDLQLWRNSGGNGVYTKVGNTTLSAAAENSSSVYELAVNPSLPFQRGDILGIFQPHGSISRLRIHYRTESENPLNFVFRVDNSVAEPPLENFTTTSSEIRQQTVLPLVTVEISRLMPVALVTVTASTRLSPTTTTPSLSTPVITHSSIADVMPTTLPQPRGGNMEFTDESFPVMTVGIATGVGGGSLLAMFIVLIVIAVFLLIWRRKRKYSLPAEHLMDNPLYIQQGQCTHDEDRYTKVAELNANVPTGAREYELVQGPGASENIEIDFSNPLYAEPEGVDASRFYESTNLDAGNLEWGFYVPTEEQRRKLPSSVDPNENDLYSTVYSDIYTRPAKEQEFFQESNIYWVPSSDPTELYAQLAQYKFREILRHQIKTTEHLGSGQFGNVEKGVWSSPRGPVDVAVKQLNEGMAESDKVKFLKEAAIMGQFRHPHVIKLHGVVTMGVPVMIVLEFMPNGDLRDFLIQNRPSPGELTAPETPNLCLKLSRQVASGMEYLANKSFVHRDLAARNILVSAEMNCKIADFGMARDLEDSDYYVSHGGKVPVKWTAPEAINFKRYSIATDVWSFGALLFEIWSLGHKPFEGYTNQQVLRLVRDGHRLSPPPGCPRAVYKLMAQCWHPDAEPRPTFSELHGALSQPETELLGWSEQDEKVHPQAAVLGAPLEAGKDLYLELQEMYISQYYS